MDRRREVLTALREARGSAVSGEALATALGVSRAAVGKHVGALRDLGYTIDAEPGAGYRLTALPDAPVAEEVASLVTDAFWTRFVGGGPTGSTSDDAKQLARAGSPAGTVVLASEQTRGRGRLGRTWASPPGGAYLSVVLRPSVAMADVPPLALVVALGVARGLEDLARESGASVSASLKWPNDVLLDGAKLAGILLETSAEADRVDWVVVGCGLNVRHPRARASAEETARGDLARAAYLEDSIPGVTPASAAAAVLDGIAVAYGQFAAGGFPAIRPAFLERHSLHERRVTVSDREGRALAHGTVSGVDEWGRLEVETADGSVALTAGEVTLA